VGTTFHVVIERPRDRGPTAAASLAAAMAERYGIPAAQLGERLAAGSLRVKSNVDLATAEAFAKDLESIGAVCAIVDAATGAPYEKPKPAPKPSGSPLAGIASSRPASSHQPFSSGLSAASAAGSQQDLGALSSGEFALSTLDGADEPSAAGSGERPADSFMPASFGPAAPALPEPQLGPAVDPFAPPDAEQEPVLDLDVDPAQVRRPGKVSTLPVPNAAPAPASAHAHAGPVADEEPAAPPRARGLAGLAGDRRVRLAAGVVLAILLGFIPAHLVAAVREDSAYAQIDKEIQARYKSVLTEADWDALDAMLARQIERKKDRRRSIALASFLIWGLAGGGVAFVWFRKLDWDAIVARLEP
jgi:hypothetical protein